MTIAGLQANSTSTSVFAERAIVVTHSEAPFGDFRDWDEIGSWASTIADALAEAGDPVK